MSATPTFKLNVGTHEIKINTGKYYSIDFTEQIDDLVATVKAKHSNMRGYCPEPGETLEDWEEKGAGKTLTETKTIRRKDEDEDAYLVRVNRSMSPKPQKLAFDILNGLAEMCEQQPVSEEAYRKLTWSKVRDFLYKCLDEANSEAANMFAPKRHSTFEED